MAGAVSASSTRLVTPVSASRVCSRPSLERLNPTARFLSIQTAQGLTVQTAQGKAARQFTRKTLCQAHVNENKNGDRSEGLPVTKRDFLAGSAAAAAAVTLTPWGAALADGGFAVDEVTGKPIAVSDILQKAASVDRILVRGLDNNPTYLLVDDGKVADYALRAVCTHMGCTPDWVGEDGKFECPCHGSQYNARGEVVEGPAPENLALVHVKIDGGKVRLDDWNEADFRNGETDPWWI